MTQPLPRTRLMCVQYPGNVENAVRAIESLGGPDNVRSILSNPPPTIPVNWPYMNVSQSQLGSVQGELSKTNNLLLKVIRSPSTVTSDIDTTALDSTAINASIVGIVRTTYAFNSMADFDYASGGSGFDDMVAGDVDSSFNLSDLLHRNEVIDLPPPFFSRLNPPNNYNFRQSKNITGSVLGDIVKPSSSSAFRIPFCSSLTPAAPPPGVVFDSMNDIHTMLYIMFERRPIWSRKVLLASIPPQFHNDTLRALPSVCYVFRNGPWRLCFIKYGYNPRTLPEARIYQVFDYRVKDSGQEEIPDIAAKRQKRRMKDDDSVDDEDATGMNNENYWLTLGKFDPRNPPIVELSPTLTFVAPPQSLQVLLQFCDVKNIGITDLIAKSLVTPTCSERQGWFEQKFYTALRKVMAAIRDQWKKQREN